jgi:post-segregation antitoxin (ccd killing protein)
MARIPEAELERIKQEVSVQRLVEASGIELKKGGENLLGKCIWHDDHNESLIVTPAKNLWHCYPCDIGGGPIDWVMKTKGVSFRHAVELLKADPSLAAGTPRKVTTTRALPTPVAFDADEQDLLTQTLDYYRECLTASAAGLAYLKARGLDHPALIDTFKLGLADRTLGLRLPMKNRQAGATIRERLQTMGILLPSGHEFFTGSLVIPVFDERGQVAEVYGRKIQERHRPGTAKHLFLRQPDEGHRARGVFNLAGIQEAAPVLSAEEEAKALELLRAPNLMQRIVADLHALGVVGEDMNLMAAYLAAISRKLDAPLAVLIQSTSAAGKSALMDAVLNLVPPEERIRYSAMTGQSLYYLGENNLSHKILAIAEEEGVRQAAYALKLLQSDGELTIASTAKDEASGNLMTRQYTVRGPVMLMLTTTAIDVDEELLNRCLVLSVNESREQTAAIHARQRQKQTLEGLLQRAGREQLEQLHHNAQRLLSTVAVVNPYATGLTFLADKTRTRRDHMKYLALIQAIALLHQHQREVKSAEHAGQVLHYIEVTKDDIALANQVAHEVLGRTLDEMPPQTRKLLRLIAAMVAQRAREQRLTPAQVRFTRRDVRGATGWSDSQLKLHCARLADMEYLLVHAGSRGHSFSYELLWDGADDEDERRLCGLIDPGELDESISLRPPQVWVETAQVGVKSGPSLGQVWPKSGVVNPLQTRAGIGAAPGKGLNGAKPHNKEGGADALGGDVHA